MGDTVARDYGEKLDRLGALIEPELARLIEGLGLPPGGIALDAGCGTGHQLRALLRVGPRLLCGIDLSLAHLRRARSAVTASLVAGDLLNLPFRDESFDLIWSLNTIGHLSDRAAAVKLLSRLLSPGGLLVLARSHMFPELLFAWDEELERRVTDACRRYYRAKYGLATATASDDRALVGLVRGAGLRVVHLNTVVIQRVSPLLPRDEAYLTDVVFRQIDPGKLAPYLGDDDAALLSRLLDPASAEFCLRRPDFHYAQTLTIVAARLDPR